MGDRKSPEEGLALRGDLDQDFAVIQHVAVAAHQPQGGQTVDEPDDGVMLELELPGEGADGRQAVGRKPLDRQEQLVLLGLEARLPSDPLAEGQEAADEVAEMGEALVIRLTQPRRLHGHIRKDYIVVRYKVNPREGERPPRTFSTNLGDLAGGARYKG